MEDFDGLPERVEGLEDAGLLIELARRSPLVLDVRWCPTRGRVVGGGL